MKHKKIMFEFWLENYNNKDGDWMGGLCGLCGNTGIIDTTHSAVSPMGYKPGGKYHCICPNGRADHKRHIKQNTPNNIRGISSLD